VNLLLVPSMGPAEGTSYAVAEGGMSLFGSTAMSSADRQWWRRYDRYLNSQGRELTREACFRRDGYRCCRCGLVGLPSNPRPAAHLTYENYNATGRTPVGDLRTLCRHCHEITTGQNFHALSAISCGNVMAPHLRQKAVLVLAAWLALALIPICSSSQ
jgi:hypothetical protein